jgi:hypothetical protein
MMEFWRHTKYYKSSAAPHDMSAARLVFSVDSAERPFYLQGMTLLTRKVQKGHPSSRSSSVHIDRSQSVRPENHDIFGVWAKIWWQLDPEKVKSPKSAW